MIFKKNMRTFIVLELFAMLVLSLYFLYSKQFIAEKAAPANTEKLPDEVYVSVIEEQAREEEDSYQTQNEERDSDQTTLIDDTSKDNKIFREAGSDANVNEKTENDKKEASELIKWVDFNVTYEALETAYHYDVDTYGKEFHINWIELLAYVAAKNGGTVTSKHCSEIKGIAEELINGVTSFAVLTKEMKYYDYYLKAYTAVLGGYVGEYEVQSKEADAGAEKLKESFKITDLEAYQSDQKKVKMEKKYGLKAFSPIAKGFPYSDYDDFGVSRSYGFRREHLGHDFMGQIGTPIIATESGRVEAIGWNQYGGWRIGIRSLDERRYYYYAHLRQNYPFAEGLQEGSLVTAGDVIGYMGHTGYSQKENVNNIDSVHLHYGVQLIFDESQKETNSEIWIDTYQLVRFLSKNRSEAKKIEGTKEWKRVILFKDPVIEEIKKEK